MNDDIATACRREAGAWIIAGIGDGWPLHQAADEIDRLRAENQVLRDVIVNWQIEAEMERAERQRLQELIDAWAYAIAHVPYDGQEYVGRSKVHAAENALLAVAAKGSNRG